jgi:L-amino acid N-acyltransferase YncA
MSRVSLRRVIPLSQRAPGSCRRSLFGNAGSPSALQHGVMTVTRSRVEAVRLRDGSVVVIRPVRASDKPGFVEAFARLSAETRRRRFCVAKPALTAAELSYLTEVDHLDHEALVAGDRRGQGLGVARYVRDREDPTSAEFAVVVCDAWQRRGLGSALSRRLVVRARAAGIHTLTAEHLADNQPVVAFMRTLGPVRHRPGKGPTRTAEIDLVAAADDQTG